MKIQLERRLPSCPATLPCTVCHQPFTVNSIRTLLYSNHGWLKGDVCPHCLKLSPDKFKQLLWAQSARLLELPSPGPSQTLLRHQESLECLELSQEDLHRPTGWHWWLKRLAIFAQESQELEATRLGLHSSNSPQRSRLEKLL
jgi:hypothetical protein